ncbi:MAG: HEAT repeat domain-containing protein [Planctomycetota bacterium]|nr:HEAT repeat domain-containing protein [Planctomycetota bacterium]
MKPWLLAGLLAGILPILGAEEPFKPEVSTAEGRRAFDDLAAYYADPKQEPAFAAALEQLKDPAKAEAAGSYLHALFKQSFADESNGRAEWKKTPFWGGGSESAAREFRKTLAKAFEEKASGAAALSAVRWLLESEFLAENQAAGMAVLKKTEAAGIAELLKDLLKQPHPNEDVAKGAVEEAGRRGLKDLAPDLLRLCTHYRTRVREAAVASAGKLGLKDLPAYKPEEAFTPWLDRQLKDMYAMVATPLPADAAFYTVKMKKPEEGHALPPFQGWLLKKTEKQATVMSVYVTELVLPVDGIELAPASLEAAAQELLEIRKKEKDDREAGEALSRRGGLTRQFEPKYLSMQEATIAAWAYQRGNKALAAAMLFPRIDAMADDRWLRWVARDYLGHHYHQQMLELFSYERDYEGALALARHLAKPLFDEYQYQERAQRLAAQLEKRGEDFKTFVLPRPAEWEEMKKKLDRPAQIRFLAERLRLLNCFQYSQPGGVSYEQEQTVKARNLRAEAAEEAAVNPYVELERMKLEVKDLADLVPFLGDEHYMPTFSYWRDFHPSRTLHQANWAVGTLVNEAAKRDLADLRTYYSLGEEGKKEHLQKILAWCRENTDKSREQLLLETLEHAEDWRTVDNAAGELVEERNAKALPLLAKRAEAWAEHRVSLVKYVYMLNLPEGAPHARRWLKDADVPTAFWAALILLKHGDPAKEEGMDVLQKALPGDKELEFYPFAVQPLLATKREAALGLAAGILKQERFSGSESDHQHILKALLLAGRDEAMAFIAKEFENQKDSGTSYGEWEGKEVSRDHTKADHMAAAVDEWRKERAYQSLAPDDVRAKQRAEVLAWLRAQFALIKAGKAPEMDTKIEPVRGGGEWHVDAP